MRVRTLLLAAIVFFGMFLLLVLPQDEADKPKPTLTETTRVDTADADRKADDAVPLPEASQQLVERAEKAPDSLDLGGGLRGEDSEPAGVLTGPLAAQEWPGCRTLFVRSHSARTASIAAIGLHYTAGGNLPGWQDLLGLTAYSNNVGNGVSWHWGIDREGNCAYNVPATQKAWTIGNLNSQTLNIEVVGRGNEPDYAGPGFKKLSAVVRRAGRIYNIPMRLGAVSNCRVTRRGIITHWMGGACSGGHHDIRPYSIESVVARIARDAERENGTAARRRKLERSHRIVHAKIAERCRVSPRPSGCRLLYARNGQLHAAMR
jgi:hypothetical protein